MITHSFSRSVLSRLAMGFVLTLAIGSVLKAESVDMERMRQVDRIVESAIEQDQLPGAVLLVGAGDEVVYRKAYGQRAVEPQKVAMTPDTVFDLASLSKSVGCATSIMLLVERGQLNLSDRVAKYLPAFAANGKQDITVEQLLLHWAGLIPDNSMTDYTGSPADCIAAICALKLTVEPGTKFIYSDLGYIVLGELVKTIAGKPLDEFARTEIFEPMGMKDTGYNPSERVRTRCAPTEKRDGQWMMGQVHDPRAYALGGVAGHAGLFSTADDLSRYCRMMINGGTIDNKRILSEATIREMIRPRCLADNGCRAYGFDVDTGYSSPRGNLFEVGTTFGHTGFTGTSFWMDPVNRCYVILLSNAVHPAGKGSVSDLRRRVATVVASAIPLRHPGSAPQPITIIPPAKTVINKAQPAGADGEKPTPVATVSKAQPSVSNCLCGIDVLKRDGFKPLEGRRIALITNQTGRDREGNRTVDLLRKAGNCQLVKLFSPEHGLYGKLDEVVGNTVDEQTGLTVYSLYGKTRRPNDEMLADVDTLVFDIQDVGARFYTYSATLGICMEEAAKRQMRYVVLDRPNPITGLYVDGPLADKERWGFTAYNALPVAHGMTFGELAELYNTAYKINCDLQVIRMEGWRRSMWFDATGLTWINPSPNMRNLTQATLYPGVCLLEACNISVGRGTDQPFEMIGAPWLKSRETATALNEANIPGLRFVPIEFTPTSSKFATKPCQGLYILVTDRNALQSVPAGLTIAWWLKKIHGPAFDVKPVMNLLANAEAMNALQETDDPTVLPALWRKSLESFQQLRSKFLIYPE